MNGEGWLTKVFTCSVDADEFMQGRASTAHAGQADLGPGKSSLASERILRLTQRRSTGSHPNFGKCGFTASIQR